MSEQHTPGPWRLRTSWAKGYFVETLAIPPAEDDSTSFGKAVTHLPEWTIPADTRLIAAAPETTEALEALVRAVERAIPMPQHEKALARARAAIAQAKGER